MVMGQSQSAPGMGLFLAAPVGKQRLSMLRVDGASGRVPVRPLPMEIHVQEGSDKSLQGNWRAEHLFALKQALALFDFIGTQLAECDGQIEAQLQSLQAHQGTPAKGKKWGRARNAPKFDVREHLFKMCGVDLTRIDGIDVSTALVVVSELGCDMSRFATVGHFTSWLGLCVRAPRSQAAKS
jgi:hypothetical protein